MALIRGNVELAAVILNDIVTRLEKMVKKKEVTMVHNETQKWVDMLYSCCRRTRSADTFVFQTAVSSISHAHASCVVCYLRWVPRAYQRIDARNSLVNAGVSKSACVRSSIGGSDAQYASAAD